MGGVPGEEEPTFVPSGRPPGTEPVPGVADQRGVVGPDIPWLEECPRGLLLVECFERLTRQAHELPAAPSRTARHHGCGASGITHLEVRGIEDPWFLEGDVHDQPVEEEPAVLERRPEQVTHRAVGAVAAHDVGRVHPLPGTAVRWLELDPGPVGVPTRPHRGMAPQERDALGGLHPFEELELEVGLIEHVGCRPSLSALHRRLETEQRDTVPVAPLVGGGRFRYCRQVRSEPTGLQDAGGLVIEVNGAGQRIGPGVALDQEDAPAPQPEKE